MTPTEWARVEREIVSAWNAGNIADALKLIEDVLTRGTDEFRGRALMYRGSIQEEEANWTSAGADFHSSRRPFGFRIVRQVHCRTQRGPCLREDGTDR